MLMIDDARDVLDAFKQVVKESDELIKTVESVYTSQSPSDSLEAVCRLVHSSMAKMKEIAEHCEKLQDIPASINEKIRQGYDSERHEEHRKLVETITPQQ